MAIPIKEYKHYCKYCGKLLERKRFKNERLEDFNVFKKRVYCNRECMKSDFVKKGFSTQSYRQAHQSAKTINKNILKQNKCAICGTTDKKLDIHHIDKNWHNNNLDNLIVLCRSCHVKIHRSKRG